jgi:peptidoglycan/xylan/chitin deacetylase (PgdA/CDA1 family)
MKPQVRLLLGLSLLALSDCGIGRTQAKVGTAGVVPADATALPPVVMGTHGLPVLPSGPLPKPTGAAGNLTVLDWAGFRAAVSWSFDDGQPSHIAHYAALSSAGVPMTFYLTCGHGGEPGFDATWAQAARDGHELGNHAVHHCRADLTGCIGGRPGPSLEREIDDCTAYLTQHYPQPGVWTIAAPYGDAGYESLARSRFLVNRSVWPGMIAPRDALDPMSLPSYSVAEGDTAARMNRQTRLARSGGKWLIFLVHTLLPTDANWYAPVPVAEVVAGMRYGRSLGDVWMGTVADVAAYWIGQRLLLASKPSQAAGAMTWTWKLPVGFPPGKYLRVRVDGGTLAQAGAPLEWDVHGYYEVALDSGSLTLAP